jgi:hypothetical protein
MSRFLSYNCLDGTSEAIVEDGVIILGGGWNPPLTDPTSPAGPVNGQETVWTGTALTGVASSIAISATGLGGLLTVEQSFDGLNWNIAQAYEVPAASGEGILQQVIGPFLRLVYENTSGGLDDTVHISARIFGSDRVAA